MNGLLFPQGRDGYESHSGSEDEEGLGYGGNGANGAIGEGAGGSSEDEMEFEEVLPGQENGQKNGEQAGGQDPSEKQTGGNIEVTLKPSTVVNSTRSGKRGKGGSRNLISIQQAAYERAQRQEIHKVHTSALLVSGFIRNGWMNDTTLQARLLSKCPLSIQSKFFDYSKTTHPKATDRSRLFEGAMQSLAKWWTTRFKLEDAKTHPANLVGRKGASVKMFEAFKSPHSLDTVEFQEMRTLLENMEEEERIRLLMPFPDDEDLQAFLKAYPPPSTNASPGKDKGKGREVETSAPKPPKAVGVELGEQIRNAQSLSKRALKMSGTKDISVQLFTSLCRALDIPARLACALPSVDYRSATKIRSDDKIARLRSGEAAPRKRTASLSYSEATDEDDEGDADFEEVPIPSTSKSSMPSKAFSKAAKNAGNVSDISSVASVGNSAKRGSTKRKRAAAATASMPSSPASALSSSRKGKAKAMTLEEFDDEPLVSGVPVFWTEVYNRSLQEWITIDIVRNKYRPRKGELDNGRLFYVVAYEVDQYVKDVTPRYAKSYAGKTLKMRIQNARGTSKDEPPWFEKLIAPWQRPFSLGREVKEDEDLQRTQILEPMPTVLEGFKNHPRYVLARHLKREEVILPKTKQLGLFRGEPVYPRTSIVDVKSSESWMREGRRVREGEQPFKMVKQRAVTINKRRAQEMAEQEGMGAIQQGLYGRQQTELVIPEPIKDGKIPKNSYGNLDLFAPHMLPRGAVHLPFKTTSLRRLAKDLGIDYSEAVTGFEFHKRRAVPTVEGIVVASANEQLVLDAYWEAEQEAATKEETKRRERSLKRWKKLIVGLRVRSRIQGEYKKSKAKEEDKGKTAGDKKAEQSQFVQLPEDDADTDVPQLPNAPPPDASATTGGFIHVDSVHPDVPGGAAFPPMPAPSSEGLELPPMPVPEPQDPSLSMPDAANGAVSAKGTNGGASMDLDSFTLADPETLAQSGGQEINADYEDAGSSKRVNGGRGADRSSVQRAEGGFIREDDSESDEEEEVEMEEVVDAAVNNKVKQQIRGNGQKPIAIIDDGDTSNSDDMDEAKTQNGTDDDTLAVVDFAQKPASPATSPPSAKRVRRQASSSPAKSTPALNKPPRSIGSHGSTASNEQEAPSSSRPRRSTRAGEKASEASGLSSLPSSTSRPTRASKRNNGNPKTQAASKTTSGEAVKRPTRAAAVRGRGKKVVEHSSTSEEDGEQESELETRTSDSASEDD